MRVALVTTWETACGIAEHSAYLKETVEAADPGIEIVPLPEALDPAAIEGTAHQYDVLHLNYQAALHSRWTPERIRHWQGPVMVTYHDTGVPNSDQCRAICAAADAFVVHEPYDDLEGNGRYWRMGVPAWTTPYVIDRRPEQWSQGRPTLGTVGFPFPWKNYDELARVTAANGWAFLVIAPTATMEQQIRWHDLNQCCQVIPEFLDRRQVVAQLAGCDATAFCYTCANTGQSGAVLQGIAARKPVIAFSSCRQFRALNHDDRGCEAIWWCQTFEQVGMSLREIPIQRCDPATIALAEQDSWAKLGVKYAALFREPVQ